MRLERLKKEDFNLVLKRGEKIKVGEFLIKWLKNDEIKIKVGVLVSKKIFKKAVLRNRLKRLIREGMRKNLDLAKIGLSIIFIPRFPPKLEFQIIENRVREVLEKINAKSNF